MQLKRMFVAVSLCSIGFVAGQIVGTAELLDATNVALQTNLVCGPSCPISGKWIAVSQAFLNVYGCGTLVRLTHGTFSTVAPICDVCSACQGIPGSGPWVWQASAPIFSELGIHSGAIVDWNI
ncbi:hypothetical protein BOTBODRAFT_367939 [Botryobasidium botryosum FD-172 SS1]|uniref:RlpA-like protein double-psi beta-barrel domain-containing protein n=1 Tax=Botryobasidium botryosum (strain FD-172 SS1) TaxID=930990 RepID=A0A067MPC7_BOTB1|nr:hypothetical protein BOTBODRAFT_367939 [Botryobasidium botryosum FD-172 SS1]